MSAYPSVLLNPQIGQEIAQAPQNALAEYARTAALKQQTAQSQAVTQGQQLENQKQQIQVQDQQAGLAALKDPDFKSMNDLPDLIQKHGGSFNAINGARANVLDYNTKLQNLTKDQLQLEATKNDAIAGHIDTVKTLPPEKQPQGFEDAKTDLVNRGYMTPQEAQSMQYPGADGLDALEKLHVSHTAQVEQNLKTAQANEADQKARNDSAQAAHQEFVNKLTTNSKPGDFDSQIDSVLPPNDAQTGGPNKYTKAMVNGALSRGDLPGAQKVMDQALQSQLGVAKDIQVATNPQIQAGKVEVAKNTAAARQQAQTGGYGQPGDPMIDMVGQNRIDLATALQRVPTSAKDTFLKNLSAAYPDYNQGTFGVEKKANEAFTSGSQGQQLTSIDTARQHMKTFKQTADALDNGNVLVANQLGNAIGVQFGNDAPTNFQIARAAFAGEVGKAFAGASVAEGDRRELLDKINAASSPAQLKGYADTADELLAGKQTALKRSYDASQQGKPNFGAQGGKTQTSKFNVGDSVMYQGKAHKVTAVDPQTGKLTLAP